MQRAPEITGLGALERQRRRRIEIAALERFAEGARGEIVLVIGREGRAYVNKGLSGSTFWTPVINIVRDP
jgi:hypothetical protein